MTQVWQNMKTGSKVNDGGFLFGQGASKENKTSWYWYLYYKYVLHKVV